MTQKHIDVRMYNVGFGDCFLIGFGNPKRLILVDAGFHAQGKGAFSSKELVAQILADVERSTGRKRIDVVIATHRHQDHVYTFNSELWDEVEVGEVWMPWVEDRKNPEAKKLWKNKKKVALLLDAALPAMRLSQDERQEVEFLLWNAGVGGKPEFPAWSNAGALDRLHDGFASRDREVPRFLPEGDTTFPETFSTEVLPGVKITVLGPPRDPALLSEGNPIADGESYRTLALLAAAADPGSLPTAFSAGWVVPTDVGGPRPLEPQEERAVEEPLDSADILAAAKAVDGMINATSLVLLLQIGTTRLLLPGDAEWGTWKLILENKKARALLKKLSFIKLGHHGSHNGTPVTVVEEVLPTGVKAMLSTQEGPGSYRNNIPLPELLEQLEEHGIVMVRSDELPDEVPKGFSVGPDEKWVDLKIPYDG